jgi:YVTN family beta-propeller protein
LAAEDGLIMRAIIRSLVLLALPLLLAAAAPLPISVVADIPLPGRTTRWDYASLDPLTHHLFLAHLGDSAVTVVDTQSRQVIATISGIEDVHGVLTIPELGRVYATATGANQVVVIDAQSLKVIARAPTGAYPDGMAYAPAVHQLYISDEHGGTDTVVDTITNQRVATIKIGRETGNTQYDLASRHIFANSQDSGELVEIDPATNTVVARIALPGARGNHGLYIDATSRRAFIACEGNDKLMVLDLASRRILSSFDLGGEPDVLAFDPAPGWLYVAGESGVVSIFKVEPGKVSKLAEAFLGPNAHVVAVDPATHLAYFPLKDVGGRSVLRVTAPRTE